MLLEKRFTSLLYFNFTLYLFQSVVSWLNDLELSGSGTVTIATHAFSVDSITYKPGMTVDISASVKPGLVATQLAALANVTVSNVNFPVNMRIPLPSSSLADSINKKLRSNVMTSIQLSSVLPLITNALDAGSANAVISSTSAMTLMISGLGTVPKIG
jgi:hypothetical protein